MEINTLSKYRTIVIRLEGEIDHHSAGSIRDALEKEIHRSGAVNIAFDMGRVSFMDSSGIGMIIGRYKTVTALGGAIIIYNATESIKRLMSMAGIAKIAIISDNLHSALKELTV